MQTINSKDQKSTLPAMDKLTIKPLMASLLRIESLKPIKTANFRVKSIRPQNKLAHSKE